MNLDKEGKAIQTKSFKQTWLEIMDIHKNTHTKQNKTTQTKQANQEGVWEICRQWTFQSEKPEQTF